jgi:hypothetical protein
VIATLRACDKNGFEETGFVSVAGSLHQMHRELAQKQRQQMENMNILVKPTEQDAAMNAALGMVEPSF